MKAESLLQEKISLALLNDLVKGKLSIDSLTMKNRLPRNLVMNALDSLENEGFVIHVDEEYKATTKRKKQILDARKLERMGISGKGVKKRKGKRRVLNAVYQRETIS